MFCRPVMPLVLILQAAAAALFAAEPAAPDREWATVAPLAVRSLLLDGAGAGRRLVAVGERGHILISDDGGTTWNQVSAPTRATLTAVFFLDDRLGWAVGHDAVVLKTEDAGKTWQLVYCAPEMELPLLDVWFGDAETGFAVGAYGTVLTTRDGGTTWRAGLIEEDGDSHLNHIARAPSGRIYVAAERGTLYRSDDLGQTWATLPTPYKGSFFGTLPLGNDVVLLFGLRGHLFRSADAGRTWLVLDSRCEDMLTSGVHLADDTIVIAGLAGAVLISRDGGKQFALHRQSHREGASALVPGPAGTVILLGEGGVRRLDLTALKAGRAEAGP